MKKKIIVGVLIVLTLVFAVGAYVNNKFQKINYVDIYDEQEDLGINEKDPSNNDEINEEKTIENILILGVDSRLNEYSSTRSDVIMVLSIDSENEMFKFSSVMRDSYLYIPDKGYFDKVTHAYAFGGGLYALKTINTNLDLDCEEFVTVDFEAVENIIDNVGGVEIDVDSSELPELNRILTELNEYYSDNVELVNETGLISLNGRQAVAYARIRYDNGGDYERTLRQKEVVSSVFEQFKEMSIADINSTVDDVLPLVSMSINKTELLSYLAKVNEYKNYDIDMYGFPQNYSGFNYDSVYYVFPNSLNDEVSKLHEFIYGYENYVPSETVNGFSDRISSIIN